MLILFSARDKSRATLFEFALLFGGEVCICDIFLSSFALLC